MLKTSERLHARGPNREACIIIRSFGVPDGGKLRPEAAEPDEVSYQLASGDRLNPTADPLVFETLDGKRRFTVSPPGSYL